jgi:hypothetical protein
MSTVRMCDNPNCAEIFSEMEEGWTTSQQIQRVSDKYGNPTTAHVTVDLCPDCSGNTKELARKLSEGRKARRLQRLELETRTGSNSDIDRALMEAEKEVEGRGVQHQG